MTASRKSVLAVLSLCVGAGWAQAHHRTPDVRRLAIYSKSLPVANTPEFGLEQAITLSAWPLACLDHPQAAPEGSQYLWIYGQRPELLAEYDKTRAFFGCYDWHSAVNSTWMMVALSKDYPNLPLRRLMQERLGDHLGEKKYCRGVAVLKQAKQFEKP